MRSISRELVGGMKSARVWRIGANMLARSRLASWPARIGMALVERRAVDLRPQAGARRRHGDQACRHRPSPARSRAASAAPARCISMAWTSSTRSTERSGSGRSISSTRAVRLRPSRGQRVTPCWAGMKAKRALGLLAERPQEGRGIAQAQHGLAAHVRPHFAQPRAQQPHRHLAEGAAVELVEIEDVRPHAAILAETEPCGHGGPWRNKAALLTLQHEHNPRHRPNPGPERQLRVVDARAAKRLGRRRRPGGGRAGAGRGGQSAAGRSPIS